MTRSALTSAPLHPLLADRWSPRDFDADHLLPEATLTALLEAARWSPSANVMAATGPVELRRSA